MTQPFSGKRAVTSSDRKKSGRSISVRPPSIVSWSVSVTSDMPRALHRSYWRAGSA